MNITPAADFGHKQKMPGPVDLSIESESIDTMNINKTWHERNKMPKKPSFEQRVAWHLEHQKHCTCAPVPKKLLEEMVKKGIKG